MLSFTEILLSLLLAVIRFAPSFLIGAIGLYLAITRRKRHPRVSKFAIVGFSALLLIVLVQFGFQLWLAYLEDLDTMSIGEMSTILASLNIASNVVNLVALSAICAAVFVDRNPQKIVLNAG